MSPGLAAYTSVTFLFALTPGATTAVVVRNTIEGGWREGVRAAVGAAGVYAAIHISIAFCCHFAWAGAFDRLRVLFKQPVFARTVEGATGTALLWLAWRMAVKI